MMLSLSYFFLQIGPIQGSHSEKARVKVKVHLNLHGIVSVESATVSKKSNKSSNCVQLRHLLQFFNVRV